jgi:hypothetical protein
MRVGPRVQMYEATLAELSEANSINANSRALLSQLEENFSAASTQYEATLQVAAGRGQRARWAVITLGGGQAVAGAGGSASRPHRARAPHSI